MAEARAAIARGYTHCRFGQMHFRESGHGAPVLVLLHQNPSSSLEYEGLIGEMACDRRVIALDTPGYGMSDPPPEPLSMSGYAAAFADAIDALDITGPYDVFGFHTGALLAIELALLQPESVGRLVLSGVPMRKPAERAARLTDARATPGPTDDGQTIIERSAALWRYVVTSRAAGVPLDWATRLFAEKNQSLDRGWWAYEGVWSYDYARLALIPQPTLVLQPHDALLEISREACGLIPDGRFVDLPGLDRDIFFLGNERLAAAMRGFLGPTGATVQ